MMKLNYTLTILIGLSWTAAARADLVRTVALSGAPAPGTSGGVNFGTFFNPPALNDSGQTAFFGSLTGTGVNSTNSQGIWSEGGGSGLHLVARAGNPAPGTSTGVNFGGFGSPVLNASGQTAFLGSLTGTGVITTNDVGLWSEGGGSGLQLVAREGNPAPGTGAGVVYSSVGVPALNDSGQTAFFSVLTGPGVNSTNDRGIWSEGGGSGLHLVAREGNHAPGTSAGVNFNFLDSPVLNDSGQTAFRGFLSGTGVISANSQGIWSEGGGSGLHLVARAGNHAPGTSAGVNFNNLGSPVLNDSGQTAFSGSLLGTGLNSTNNSGIWSEGGGSGLQLVVRAGNPAPGTSAGVNFGRFNSFSNPTPPVLNDSGQTAFLGLLTGTGVDGTNDTGIWSEGGGSGLQLVVRAGNPAPGTSAGVNFGSFSNPPVLNDGGQTAFLGFLTGTGVDSTNDRGIWAENLLGQLTLIARAGDQLDVDDGPLVDLRTISFLNFFANTGNGDGRPSGFNNLGQLAFQASFTDGSSGVFVSNLAAVPEASTLLVWSILTAGVVFRATKRRRVAA